MTARLRHLVAFRLTDPSPENVAAVVHALRPLAGAAIPGLLGFEVGPNVVPSERAYDVGVLATFAHASDVETYRSHPAHVAAVSPVEHLFAHVVGVDFPQG